MSEYALKRDKKGRLVKGTPPGPGRPLGSGGGLKDYDRRKFIAMTDEEKEEFLLKIAPELRYRMAEGNPATKIGGEEDEEGNPVPVLVKFIDGKDDKNTRRV